MSDELGDFLRRVAQRYGQPAPQQPGQPVVLEAEIVEDAEILDPGDVTGQDVSQHVQQRMDTSSFSRRASALGAAVDQSDDRMGAHVHEVFTHDLGRLGSRASARTSFPTPSAPAAPPPPDVEAPVGGTLISELLRNRGQIRNAILLSEILNRPETLR
jgi:hypothetical protein